MNSNDSRSDDIIRIVVVGAGWWSQGWHLPQISRNQNVKILAIVDPCHHPTSSLNPDLESLTTLSTKYDCLIFRDVSHLLSNDYVRASMNGVIVCTPHHTHYEVGMQLLEECRNRRICRPPKDLFILMEKPISTNMKDCVKMHNFITSFDLNRFFLVNHSANYRTQARIAREWIASDQIGSIQHINASMASPLTWLFENPKNIGWVQPSVHDDTMLGNGFAWGQSCHLLGWIYHVISGQNNIQPQKVFCSMQCSKSSGADISHTATVICTNDVNMSVSGTCLLPGYEHDDPPVSKKIDIAIYGTKGVLYYEGLDRDVNSGHLRIIRHDGKNLDEEKLGFQFENCVSEGMGPESLQEFLDACRGKLDYYCGADSHVALCTVKTIEAMYRSNHLETLVSVFHDDEQLQKII